MSYETNDKMVSHPDHYKSGKYEVIDIIDEFTKDLSGTEAVCTANAIKYVLRWKKKNGVQDLKKAVWYLTHLVEYLDDKEREEHAKFDDERLEAMFTPRSDLVYHMEGHTSGGGIKISDADKAYVASLGFKKIIIHHVGCIPDEVIDISELAPKKLSIDDEPEPHTLQQASTGVYIPDEPNAAFMNPPYDKLMKQCKEYYKANENLREQFQDACDNIKLLEEDLGNMAEEIKGLKAKNAELHDVISTTRSRLANSHYTKKDIRDWLEPYSVKVRIRNDKGRSNYSVRR